MGEPENNEIAGLPPVDKPILPNSNSDDKSKKIGERSPSSNEEHGETSFSDSGTGGKSSKDVMPAKNALGYVISYDDSTQDGYIRIEDIEDRIYFKRTDVRDNKDLNIGVAVTCGSIEKKDDGTLCVKDIIYEHVEGKVISYNEETKEGYLSKNVCFNSKDIKGHFPIIKDANVSYDVIFSANGTKYAKNIEVKSTPTIKLYSRVYGEVSRAKWKKSGYITIKNNEDIKDRVFFKCSDVAKGHKYVPKGHKYVPKGPKHVPNGAMVTCDIHKESNGQLVAKEIEYKHSKGTVLRYDENTHEGFLTKNVFFRSDDIIEHYLVIPGSKVSYDVIDENGISYAKNIKVIKPFYGKVKSYDNKQRKGIISIKNIGNVHVDIKDVENYPQLIINAKVKCNIVKEKDKFIAKHVISRRFMSYAPYYLFCAGFVIFLIFKFCILRNYQWGQLNSYYFGSIEWTTIILYISTVNLMTLACYGYDKIIAEHNKNGHAKISQPRVTEASLHIFEYLGGWLFALLSQHWFKHKLNGYYQNVFWFIVLDHIILLLVSCICFLKEIESIFYLDILIPVWIAGLLFIFGYNFLINIITKQYINEDLRIYYPDEFL